MRETLCSSHAPCQMTTATTTLTTTTSATQTSTVTSTTSSVDLATLFCWSVIRIDGPEPALLQAQFDAGASIFRCNEYDVLSNGGSTWLAGRNTPEIPVPTVEKDLLGADGVTTDSWVNTKIFMEAWRMISADGRYANQEWTVKVDPDAVFFPDRLAVKLAPYDPFGGTGYLVNNCGAFVDFGWSKFYGSLEVFSKTAIETYLKPESQKMCEKNLEGWEGWGEDLYISQCLGAVLGVKDLDLFDLLGDKRCVDAPCTDKTKVAFHDFKDPDSWMTCWEKSGGVQKKVEPSWPEQEVSS